MVVGWITRIMVMYGGLTLVVSGLIIVTGIGFIPIMDGHGYPIIAGDGRHFITAVG